MTLQKCGVAGDATVTRLYITHGKYAANHVRYIYHVVLSPARQTVFEHDETVSTSFYNTLHIGQIVPILYDPQRGGMAEFNVGDELHQVNPLLGALRQELPTSGLSYLLLLFFPFILVGIQRARTMQSRLVAYGNVAPALKVTETEVAGRYGKTTSVTYEFQDCFGTLVTGTRTRLPARSDLSPKSQDLLGRVLGNPLVLYDPDNSKRNTLYPADYVDCVNPSDFSG